jgi:hypothetical protein
MAKRRPRNKPTQEEPTEVRVWPEQVMGGKYVRLLEKELQKLRREDEHGNRQLFLDDVFVVHLLAFYNPTVNSLRTVEDFSQTIQVQKHLSIRKICKSTFSDFNALVDPQRLQPILQALKGQLRRKQVFQPNQDYDLAQLLERTIAVDGTFLPAVAEVAWAVRNANNHGAQRYRARLDCQLDVAKGIPEVFTVPEPGQSEAEAARHQLLPGNIYLYDRGYMNYALLAAHYEEVDQEYVPRCYFVSRYRPAGGNSPELQQAVERELTAKDRAAGVVSDRVGCFVSSHSSRHRVPRVQLREVILQYEENGTTKTVRLITNLMDVSATTIAQLYRYRWQVELFFRWLKTYANFTHLMSHSREGVLTHLYVTVIAAMLLYLHTGFRPSKYLFALLGQVAIGAATLEEIIPILRERERQCELARKSAAARRAKQKP